VETTKKKKKTFANQKAKERAREVRRQREREDKKLFFLLEQHGRTKKFHSFSFPFSITIIGSTPTSFSLESERPTTSSPLSSERSAVFSSPRSRGARTASGQERLGKEQGKRAFLSLIVFFSTSLSDVAGAADIGSALRAPCSRSFRAVPRARSRTGSHRSFRAP